MFSEPLAPTGITINQPAFGTFTVSWNSPSDGMTETYKYRYEVLNGDSSAMIDVNGTSLSVNVLAGRQYTFYAYAVRYDVTSEPSASATKTAGMLYSSLKLMLYFYAALFVYCFVPNHINSEI